MVLLSIDVLAASFKSDLLGMLFPRDSESREVKDLSGFWNFRADFSAKRNAGFEEKWFSKPLWQVTPHNKPGVELINSRFLLFFRTKTKVACSGSFYVCTCSLMATLS